MSASPSNRPIAPSARRRPARSPTARSGVLLAASMLLLGCAGDSSSAQQEAAVPAERSAIGQRADRARVKGDSAAPVQLFEVADFECSFCAQYYRETFPAIDSLYIETGKVRYVFITYPNANHARAWPAAEAAYCAGAAGKFWPMHDLLFERQDAWSQASDVSEVFAGYAEEVGVDRSSFVACLENDRTAPVQVRDLEQVSRAGISSTPFFIINNQVSLQGAVPLDRFRTVLDSVLEATQGDGSAGAPGGSGSEDAGDGSG